MPDPRRLTPGLMTCPAPQPGEKLACYPADEQEQLEWQQREYLRRLMDRPHSKRAQSVLPKYLRDDYVESE